MNPLDQIRQTTAVAADTGSRLQRAHFMLHDAAKLDKFMHGLQT